jgi:hypothetical protein
LVPSVFGLWPEVAVVVVVVVGRLRLSIQKERFGSPMSKGIITRKTVTAIAG